MRRALRRALLLASLSACHPGAPTDAPLELELEVVVQSDPGVHLAGVEVLVDGGIAGRTSESGVLQTVLMSRPGRVHRVEPRCPPAHDSSEGPIVLRPRSYRFDADSPPIELRLTCRPSERLAAFLVRAANGPGLPVHLNGEVVATTNESGVAHFSTSGPPGSEYLVELDAGGFPRLLPRKTSHAFVLPDSHELFVVERAFQRRPPVKRARSRRPRILKIE